ncbi:MAG: ribonuclease T [Gammaproteobacteria bacterium]|nr:MAG: ribonuclease T [Gammaproteobacteria bacterium]
MTKELPPNPAIAKRFRSFLPVVVDLETAGLNAETDALLQIAAVILRMDENGKLYRHETHSVHIEPFPGANLDEKSLEFNKIDPYHPLRMAVNEQSGLGKVFKPIRQEIKDTNCTRAIIVAHNIFFDMQFLTAAVKRAGIKRNPFHPFSGFDTATLAGLAYGQTVLAKALHCAGIEFNQRDAHSAIYDAEVTADLFCNIVNKWDSQFPLPK